MWMYAFIMKILVSFYNQVKSSDKKMSRIKRDNAKNKQKG